MAHLPSKCCLWLLLAPAVYAQGMSGGLFVGAPAAVSVDNSPLPPGQLLMKRHGFQAVQPPPAVLPGVPSLDLLAVLQQHGAPGGIDVDDISLDYNVFTFIRGDVVLDEIRLTRPVLHLERDADGWNLAHLIKARTPDPDRPKNRRTLEIGEIAISDGTLPKHETRISPSPRKLSAMAAAQISARVASLTGPLSGRAASPDSRLPRRPAIPS